MIKLADEPKTPNTQTIELAAEAIRGHSSAHSFATGPVMADPAQQRVSRESDEHPKASGPFYNAQKKAEEEEEEEEEISHVS